MKNPDIGVLLLQLGTPDQPTTGAVRRYLAEFLSDRRVVDTPRWLWLPILHGIILRRRPARSAALYRKIWRDDGISPLLHYTKKQAAAVDAALGEKATIRFAMRYGNPGINVVLDEMMETGVQKLLVYPLYPQYSASTTGSCLDAVANYFADKRAIPTIRFAQPFFADPLYISALAQVVRKQVKPHEDPLYLFTFHGLPKRHAVEGDPYDRQCRATARLLALALGLDEGRWLLSFQSRFGREEWLLPATDEMLHRLPGDGEKRVVAVCPGFVSDCLETLEEIAETGKKDFLAAGGETFQTVPCLNDSHVWTEALINLVAAELNGWD